MYERTSADSLYPPLACKQISVRIINFNNVALQILAVIIIGTVAVESYNAASTIVEDERVSSIGLLDDPCAVKGVVNTVLPATHTCGIVFEGVAIVPRQKMRLRPCECVISVFSRVAKLVVFAGCMLIIPNCKIAVKF